MLCTNGVSSGFLFIFEMQTLGFARLQRHHPKFGPVPDGSIPRACRLPMTRRISRSSKPIHCHSDNQCLYSQRWWNEY